MTRCLPDTGFLREQWKRTLGIRHSQFAYTTGGSILWSASVSRGGAECLFFFRFADSLEDGDGKRFRFFSPAVGSTRQNTGKTDLSALSSFRKRRKKEKRKTS